MTAVGISPENPYYELNEIGELSNRFLRLLMERLLLEKGLADEVADCKSNSSNRQKDY